VFQVQPVPQVQPGSMVLLAQAQLVQLGQLVHKAPLALVLTVPPALLAQRVPLAWARQVQQVRLAVTAPQVHKAPLELRALPVFLVQPEPALLASPEQQVPAALQGQPELTVLAVQLEPAEQSV
jgi:hypothetical protein